MKNLKIENSLNQFEKPSCRSLKCIVQILLGNQKAQNYHELVCDLLQSQKDMGEICPKNYIFCTPAWISSLEMPARSRTNKGNIFTKTFLPWKKVLWTTERKNAWCLLFHTYDGYTRCQTSKEINNLHILIKSNSII